MLRPILLLLLFAIGTYCQEDPEEPYGGDEEETPSPTSPTAPPSNPTNQPTYVPTRSPSPHVNETEHVEKEHITLAHSVPLGTLSTWLIFFCVTVVASRLGGIFTVVGLPLITGYMVIGLICGPEVLAIIPLEDLVPLKLVTQGALAFICFSAGAELYLPELRALFKRILYQTSTTAFVTFIFATLGIYAVADLLPFFGALAPACRISVASVAGAIMVARSPASAIAIVKELRAKGQFTSAVLGMTVLGDVYVLLLFSLTTSLGRTTCNHEEFNVVTLLVTLGTMLLSILIGWVIGRLLIFMFYFRGKVHQFLILPLGLCIFVFSKYLSEWSEEEYTGFTINLESLLICIVAGYVCTNKSHHRHRFIKLLSTLGPWVFLPFFTLTGATLKLQVLLQSLGFGFVVVIFRIICIFVGSSIGGRMAGVKPFHNKENMLMWMCCLTQAGVSLGLASEVSVIFPDFGRDFQTALIAVIIINQVLGPILFRVAMKQVGDMGKAIEEGEFDPDAVIPLALVVGNSPAAMAVTARLLEERWNVTMLCENDNDAKSATYAVGLYGIESRSQASKIHKMTSSDDVMNNMAAKVKKVVALTPQVVERAATSTANKLGNLHNTSATDSEGDAEAPKQEIELDEHGHPIRHLEDGFKVITFASLKNSSSHSALAAVRIHTAAASSSSEGKQETDDEHDVEVEPEEKRKDSPVSASTRNTQPSASSTTAATEDDRTPMESELSVIIGGLKSLAAVVFALSDDQMNFEAAQAVRNILQAAPKKSTLHSVRLLALLRSPSCGPLFASVQCMPIHPELHTSLLAAKLLQAPLHSPVAFMKPNMDLADMCKGVTKSLQGETLQTFTEKFTEPGAKGTSTLYDGDDLNKQTASPVIKHKPMDLLQGLELMTSKMPKNLNQLKAQFDDAWLGGEQVGEWDEARDEYVEQLAGLDENRAKAW